MKNSDVVRCCLSIALLVFVWLGYQWAIKLCITLLLISSELTVYILRKGGICE